MGRLQIIGAASVLVALGLAPTLAALKPVLKARP